MTTPSSAIVAKLNRSLGDFGFADHEVEGVTVGTTAVSRGVGIYPGLAQCGLKSLAFWSVFVPGAGESMVVRVFRYRRLTPSSPFVYSQITDAFTYDENEPGAYTIDISDRIRPGFDIVPNDTLAISRVYTAGAGVMVNSRVQWSLGPYEAPTGPVTLNEAPAVWPPAPLP